MIEKMVVAGKPQGNSLQPSSPEHSTTQARQRLRHLLLALIVIGIGIFYAVFAYRTLILHYYPSPPFVFDEGDSLADWTNTCAWSDRSDRYTVWQSLYTPFSHFVCTIANLIFGQIPPGYYSGWRQFSSNMRFIVSMHILLWFTILLPIKPLPGEGSAWQNLRSYCLNVFPFRLLTLVSFAALFSFERGNTIGVGYIFFWLSMRVAYYPRLRYIFHPFFVGTAAAIKPYIMLFSLYGRRFSGLAISFATVIVLQIIPILIVGAPGIENLPNNLAYYSREFSIMNVVAKAVYTFSFNAYRDMKRLVNFGLGSGMLGSDYSIYLNILYSISLVIFCLFLISASRCLITSINIDNHESTSRDHEPARKKSNIGSSIHELQNSRVVLLRYAIPSFFNVMNYMLFSPSSGAYVILFLIVSIFCIEEETQIISRSPLLLSLYFMGLCAFDLPGLSNKAYECGIRSISLEYFRQIPLLSELTGQQFICMGTYIGPATLFRPIFFLMFGGFLMLKLRRYIKISHNKRFRQTSHISEPAPGVYFTELDQAEST